MNKRSAFDLDCDPIIPECGFECPKCIQEIETILGSMESVSKVYMEGAAEDAKIIVEHDPAVASVERLIEAFKMLPSFYEGFFIPIVITS